MTARRARQASSRSATASPGGTAASRSRSAVRAAGSGGAVTPALCPAGRRATPELGRRSAAEVARRVVGHPGPLLAEGLEHPPAHLVLVPLLDLGEADGHQPYRASGLVADDLGLRRDRALLQADRQVELLPALGRDAVAVEVGPQAGLAEVDGLAVEVGAEVLGDDRDGDPAADRLAA